MKTDEPLYDVVAVNIRTNETRTLATGKTKLNAEAFIEMAVIRRGVDTEFYKTIPSSGDEGETK